MASKTYAVQNINMQRMISIPLQSTSTINIHVPIGDLIAQQQQQKHAQVSRSNSQNSFSSAHSGHDRDHVTRMSITSNGSSIISISPPSTPTTGAPHSPPAGPSGPPPPPPNLTRNSPPATLAKPAIKPQQPQQNGRRGGEETLETDSAMGSSQDDSRSIHSSSSNGEKDVGFNSETSSVGTGADVENNNGQDSGSCAVAVYMDKEMALLIKATCQSEAACTDQRFVGLLLSIVKACGRHLKQGEEQGEEFNAVSVNKVKLSDSRPAKEHLAEISRELDSSVTIRDAICRRMNEKGREHVGTIVHDVVKAEGSCAIARVGCLVELCKLSKYAPAREFADQLCEHIFAAQPAKLGNKDRALEIQRLKMNVKEGQTIRLRIPKHELLAQTFIFDPTINIAEAARRSFVDITGFKLFR